MPLDSPEFWLAVLQIIAINIVLSGDNAVVIALACRRLPDRLRTQGVMWGALGAVLLRIILIFFAVTLLAVPYLKVVGALLLLWIGVKLLQPESGDDGHEIEASTTLSGAIRTIIIADVVMSLDNVIAIAGAARNDMVLIIFGLAVSVPLIVWGSRMVMSLMDRFPIVIVLGAALIGWVAGDMTATDVAIESWLNDNLPAPYRLLPAADAVLVVALGKWLAARAEARRPAPLEDLAETDRQPGTPPTP